MISRKDLEIHHSNSYAMRGRLKQLGCEWDGIARAWIAPSLEVKELCLEELEKAPNEIRTRHFGRCGWDEGMEEFCDRLIANEDPSHGALPETAKPIAHTPTKEEVIKIVGTENVRRYWDDRIPESAAEILASGEKGEAAIYEKLQEEGWKSRSVSLLIDVVNHFRQFPPIPAIDEKLEQEKVAPIPECKAEEMQGSIGIICDAAGDPQLLKISFPYSSLMVYRMKIGNFGQRWNAAQKRWEVPVKHAEIMFKRFPHFQRSPKAQELENSI